MGIDPTEAVNNDDLFGEGSTSTAVAEPEIDPGTEPSGEETEVDESQPEGEAAAEAEEELQVVLPKEQAKQYSNALMSHYAKRLGANPEDLAGNQPLQKAVKQLIDQDIFIEKQKTVAEPVNKEEPKVVENQPPADLKAHLESVQKSVQEYTNPEVRAHFVNQINEAKTAEEQFGILEMAAANLINTIMEKRFGEVYNNYATKQQNEHSERIAAHNSAWEPQLAKNANLPKDALAAYVEAVKISPKLVSNPKLNAEERMETVALVLGGRKADAEAVAKAAEKGKEAGAQAQRKAGLGKLGAGQSTGSIAKKTTGNDDIFGAPGEVVLNQRLIGK